MTGRARSEDLLGAAALLLFLALPLFVPDWVLGDLAIYFAYGLLAASLAFVWGQVGLLSLGHAVYFGIGAYAMSIVTLGMVPGLPALRSSWLGLAAAVLAGGGAAFLLGWFLFASRGLKGAFLGIVTLAVAVVFERLAVNADWLGGLNGLMNVPPWTFGLNGEGGELTDMLTLYILLLGVLCVAIAGLTALARSDFGLVLAAIRDNELRAWTLGHDVRRAKMLAFAISGAVAGLAGALFVIQFGFASPSLIGFSLSADVLIWVAVGGRAGVVTAALGAIAIRFLESRVSGTLGDAWPIVLGLLFMASVLLFPHGVFGALVRLIDRLRGVKV
jgi:urea ABC transporter permease protein UrtC